MPIPTQRRCRRLPLILWTVLPALGAAACRNHQPAVAAVAVAPKTIADHFDVGLGGRVVHLQFAVLATEMQRGLMERAVLGRDEGMIFVFGSPQQLDFWMHDTPTPLDVGYFTPEGRLAEIYPLLPFDERTISSRSNELQFAVEMNQGWYRSSGILPGARLDMAAVAAALRARGFDPQKYGLAPP